MCCVRGSLFEDKGGIMSKRPLATDEIIWLIIALLFIVIYIVGIPAYTITMLHKIYKQTKQVDVQILKPAQYDYTCLDNAETEQLIKDFKRLQK